MRKLTADYIFPVSTAPIKNGILIIDRSGKIIDLLHPKGMDYEIPDIEHFQGFLCPGFVNAHCHLELSHLRGVTPEEAGLGKFLAKVVSLRNSFSKEQIALEAEKAALEMKQNGIVAAGDISNSADTFYVKDDSSIRFHTFIELFGNNPDKANKIFERGLDLMSLINQHPASITPHATYSLSEPLFFLIKSWSEKTNSIITIHHQESADENLLFESNTGKIYEHLQQLGAEFSLMVSGKRPLETVSGFLPQNNHIQLVHNVVSDQADIQLAVNYFPHLWWCLCPQSNLYIQDTLPDVDLLRRNNCAMTIGTDSLASNRCLSVLEELKVIHVNFPEIPLEEMLSWATLNGAQFLKMDNELGSFETGKRPGVLLIENVDFQKININNQSKVKVLF